MPFFILSIIGGAAFTYILRETDTVIPAFIVFVVFTCLLYIWPIGAFYFAALVMGLLALLLAIAYWELVAGIILSLMLFIFFLFGALHAINVLAK